MHNESDRYLSRGTASFLRALCDAGHHFLQAVKHTRHGRDIFTQRREWLVHGNAISLVCRHVACTQAEQYASRRNLVDRHDMEGRKERVAEVDISDPRPQLNSCG